MARPFVRYAGRKNETASWYSPCCTDAYRLHRGYQGEFTLAQSSSGTLVVALVPNVSQSMSQEYDALEANLKIRLLAADDVPVVSIYISRRTLIAKFTKFL